MSKKECLGVDIGGSGIKGAIVDINTGELQSERLRIPTPSPSTPKAVAKTFAELVDQLQWKGKIGCGFPAVVKNGIVYTASNIDKKWIDTDAAKLLSKETGSKVYVNNDADVAGLAEMRFGAGKGKKGNVLMITIGSGLGSALFIDGQLVPNTELGHIYLKDQKNIAEKYAADSVRKQKDLSWKEWGKRFDEYLLHIDKILRPSCAIMPGLSAEPFSLMKKVFDRFDQRLF